jgi:hypothetical protein
MSTFNESITLTNAGDLSVASRGLMPESKVRSLTVDACVDTGSWFLVINEATRAALGLELTGTASATQSLTISNYDRNRGAIRHWK